MVNIWSSKFKYEVKIEEEAIEGGSILKKYNYLLISKFASILIICFRCPSYLINKYTYFKYKVLTNWKLQLHQCIKKIKLFDKDFFFFSKGNMENKIFTKPTIYSVNMNHMKALTKVIYCDIIINTRLAKLWSLTNCGNAATFSLVLHICVCYFTFLWQANVCCYEKLNAWKLF